ncbi:MULTISPECIES: response regulator transcription factor [Bacillaceae]|uniref:Response regulator transcription factor n=1 Tax=Evansella alkalicola TaxID=745819 RepID=A0ABS6JNG7_9BACI|nr:MULTISPECIES: response regulator transcription factor [Bacillaceae]MBU9720101.1 response regulator transcription factor [Bacillus alkalicola]
MTNERILIVEDDQDIRELTTLYLGKKGYEVFPADNGFDAINIVKRESPHLILLDIVLPGMKGFEICEKVRELTQAPILFISSKRDSVDKIKGLEVGGDDYITKPFDFAELEARVRANLRRSLISSDQKEKKKLSYGHLTIDLESYEIKVNDQPIRLYAKELQLLLLLVNNPNQVFSAEQLYDQIWGIDSYGELKTVLVHISKLRRKIEVNPSRPKLIKTVRGFGYKFSPPE